MDSSGQRSGGGQRSASRNCSCASGHCDANRQRDLSRHRSARHADEDGYGTVATLALLLVAVLVGGMVIAGAAVFTVKARVQASADMVALAGAQARVEALAAAAAPEACAVAQQLAARNQVVLDGCVVEPLGVRVEVSQPLTLPGWLGAHFGEDGLRVSARARAGLAQVPPVEIGLEVDR